MDDLNNVREVDVNDIFLSLIEEIEKSEHVDRVQIYDGESIQDLQNSVLSIRPGKFANVYIDYIGGTVSNSQQTMGVDEDMRFQLYIVGKRDTNSYNLKLRNTSSVCYVVKSDILKLFYMNFINQPFYFPTFFGPFRKFFSDKLDSENVSCFVQELNYKACVHKLNDYHNMQLPQ